MPTDATSPRGEGGGGGQRKQTQKNPAEISGLFSPLALTVFLSIAVDLISFDYLRHSSSSERAQHPQRVREKESERSKNKKKSPNPTIIWDDSLL